MWHELLKIPHPTTAEVLVSLELLLIFYVPKYILDKVVREEEKELRKLLIKWHVKHHKGRFVYCKCSTDPKIGQVLPNRQDQAIVSDHQYLFDP